MDLVWVALWPLRKAFSRPATRAYISGVLFLVASVFLLALALVAYALFYASEVPRVNVEREVHLQFGEGHPYGVEPLDGLVSRQAYDVVVHLELPRSPANRAAGNFMIDLKLSNVSPAASRRLPRGGANGGGGGGDGGGDPAPLVHSRRTALLAYHSPFVEFVLSAASVPLVLAGWRRETEHLRVMMAQGIQFAGPASRNVPSALHLQIQAEEKMAIYGARVRFAAQLTGVRWMMYNHRFLSLIFFSAAFYTVSVASAVGAWAVMAAVKTFDRGRAAAATESGTDQGRQGSSAEESESPELSDTPRVFPARPRQPPLRYLPTPRATPDIDEGSIAEASEWRHATGEADDEEEGGGGGGGGGGGEGEGEEPRYWQFSGGADSGIGSSLEESSGQSGQRRRNRWRQR